VVRPEYREESSFEWEEILNNVMLDNVQQDENGNWSTDVVDVYGLTGMAAAGSRRVVSRKERYAPPSGFVVEGAVSRIGKTWWVKATIHERGNRRASKTASAMVEGDTGLFQAAAMVAQQVETACTPHVLERRSEAFLKKVALQIMPRQVAAKSLEEMHKKWPSALEPAAARLQLAVEDETTDPETRIIWAIKVLERLPAAGPASQRFLLRLGLDPYNILAAHCEAQGELADAVAVHLEAAQIFPGDRRPHWLEIARLQRALGDDEKAAQAYRIALKFNPTDPDPNLQLGLLLEKLGKSAEAGHYLRLFLQQAPNSPRAEEIRARLQPNPPDPQVTP